MDKQTTSILKWTIAGVAVLSILVFITVAAVGIVYLLGSSSERAQNNAVRSLQTDQRASPYGSVYISEMGMQPANMVVFQGEEKENYFTLTGELNEMNTDSIIIAGQEVWIEQAEMDREQMNSDSEVVAQGKVAADGTLIAERVTTAELHDTDYPCGLSGRVTEIDENMIVVEGVEITLIENTRIPEGIRQGDYVLVKGLLVQDGEFVAAGIQLLESPSDGESGRRFEFQGRVESIEPWVIAGVDVSTDDTTRIDAGVETGSLVYVSGDILEDGTWLADEIRLVTAERNGIIVVFVGVVENTEPWVVNGLTLVLAEDAVVGDGITAGTFVRVEAVLRSDGTYVVNRILRIDQEFQEDCFTISDVVVSVDGDHIQLRTWPELILAEDVNIEGALRPGSIVIVTVCLQEDQVLVVTSVVVIEQAYEDQKEGGKVTICHIPPGNPDNRHTITIGESAVDAHINNHGDTLGPCP